LARAIGNPELGAIAGPLRPRTRQCSDSGPVPRSGEVSGTFFPDRRFYSRSGNAAQHMESAMLGWALAFLIVAMVAAVLGFGGIAGLSIDIAKIIFFVAVVLFLISAIVGLVRGRSPTMP